MRYNAYHTTSHHTASETLGLPRNHFSSPPPALALPFNIPHSLHVFSTVAGALSSVQIAVGEGVAEVMENVSANWATVIERLTESTRGEM
jgi:hypothetical protein